MTEELSEKMYLPSSGFSNEELTVRVEDFVDTMIDLQFSGDQSLCEYFPPFVAASAGIIVFELWRRYRTGQLSLEEFKSMTLKTLGLKAGKYGALLTAMAVPGLNVVVGAYLLGSLILAVSRAADRVPAVRQFSFLAAN
ncbi:hypothetical protein [uncultured Lamprocystis sp.]|uniref:hypothetical protein n=1 Tax=uncultured Lamprocystis sp. TaxID=543132 RepID=UPI0025E4FBA9|nr:hypothetical protein [uncultured Lamprocystis sp.]